MLHFLHIYTYICAMYTCTHKCNVFWRGY